jgi:acyl-CoA reductase-like NAD-dependent aldehyde dehydrogenase
MAPAIIYPSIMEVGARTDGAGLLSTDRAEIDRVVGRLTECKDAWVQLGPAERIPYLQHCIDGMLHVAESWVREACRHQGIDPSSATAGEAWLSGPMVTIEGFRQYAKALRQGGRPRPRRLRQAVNGQTVADVFPRSLSERFLYHNMTAEVWIEPGREPTQGRIYREKAEGHYPPGRVALVLGPIDVLHKLFVEDQVVVLKMHPVNEYLGPLFERAFESLIRDGYLGVVYGGKDVGEYLCLHTGVEAIHLTGSDKTHDAIVWGADPDDQASRKATGNPRTAKQITAELGCATPILIVPGDWSESDLDFQARHVAGTVAHNASFNCNAGQVLVLARDWAAREAFVERVRDTLRRTPPRRAYYPGAHERYATFREHYPQAVVLGRGCAGEIPWTFVPEVPAEHGEHALSNEAFCGVMAEVSLDARSAPEFLSQAVALCNEKIWGTLSCAMLVDRATRRTHEREVEQAIADLHYGSIGVNVWPGVNFALSSTTWGAFPGHTAERIVSGTGVVHNALMFDHPQKSVVRSHFRVRPKPIWFADHRTLDVLGRHLTIFAASRSPWALMRVALSGLLG